MRHVFLPVGLWCFLLILFSCQSESQYSSLSKTEKDTISPTHEVVPVVPEIPDTSALEYNLLGQGLVNIGQTNVGIQTDIKYSTTDNFLQEDVYEDFDQCYLQPEVADMLIAAQKIIREKDSALSLIVFDCVRPRSVQHKMWKIVKGTPQQPYVAPPGGIGSMHNYGAAVDLSLIHRDTGLLDMGTPFDFFGQLAQPRYEMNYLKKGELTQAQLQNRWLLRKAMNAAGFGGILSEWWHFNAFPAEVVRRRFAIVE
ncbi:MAG: M15 family metallopeptidase [Bacteroidia bacterium]|nr:M15 family metallopeptidase [Bacteroidia bacterium]